MSKLEGVHLKGSERRRFERVELPFTADVHVIDRKGKRMGVIRQLGRGGLALEPEQPFKKDKRLKLVIVCEREFIRREVDVVVRYSDGHRVGLEFENLDAETAVDIGILIGKFYASESARY